jgi:hypothetical protein
MTRVANLFTNPVDASTFAWPINHNEEQPVGKSRQMADGAPTSNIGMIPQQGSATPLVMQWKGTILTKAHHVAMLQWWQICEGHSIYLTDFVGSQYEILITDYQPQRKAVAQNRNDTTNMPTWIIEYTFTFRVLRVISGPWVGVTP